MAERPIAIVTGAGSGIGRASALGLLAAGFSVVLAGRRADKLRETATQGGGDESRLLVQPTDVTQPDQVRVLFDRTVERFGRLDLLFNNAGIFTKAVAIDVMPVDDWLASVATNLTGPFLCAREAFRVMKQQRPMGGRIINNGSVSAYGPRANAVPYTATKHALTGLTKALALDGRPFSIACGQIDIGNVATELNSFTAPMPQAHGGAMIEPSMNMADVVRAVVTMATMPPSANVSFLTVMATTMPLYGRG